MKKLFVLSVVSIFPFSQFAWASEEPGLTQPQKGRVAALAEMEAQNKLSGIPLEEQMEPILPENKMFKFGTATSNSVTPLTLSALNRDFFEQMGGKDPNIRDQRGTGTIQLNLMVREVQYDTPNGQKILSAKNVDKQLARQILLQYLEDNKGIFKGYKEYYEKNGSLNIDQVTKLNERIKADILQGPEAQVKVFAKPKIREKDPSKKNEGREIPLNLYREKLPEDAPWWMRLFGGVK